MSFDPHTYWLFRPGALGDALLTVPLVTRLIAAHPNNRVVWYQSPWTSELPWARILPDAVAAALSVRSFEAPDATALLAIDGTVPPSAGAALLTGQTVIDVGLRPHLGLQACARHQGKSAYYWVAAPTATTQGLPHAAQRLCGAEGLPEAGVAGGGPQAIGNEALFPPAGGAIDVRQAWLNNPVPPLRRDERVCLIHPGAGNRAKQRPLEAWVALAAERRELGQRVRYLMGPAEIERGVRPLLEGLDIRAEIVTPGLRELPEVIGAAGNFWGHDSGPSHLAGMLGLPTHVFFGPTNPDVWRPLGPKVTVYRFQ